MRHTTAQPDHTIQWIPGFIALSAIWGSSFALIKIAVDAGMTPVWVAFWRCLFGAIALWAICLAQRVPIPRSRRTWRHAAVLGLLMNTVPFTLFAYGETHISSMLAGVWNATAPLTTLLFALAMVPDEHPTGRRMVGLLLGFAGVLAVLGVWRGVPGGLLAGSLACLGATACYGAGFAYTRRFVSGGAESASALSAVQVTCGALQLTVLAPAFGGVPTWPGVDATVGLLVLGSVGTGIAYILNLRTIRAAGPTVAATVTYLTPLWSTLLGAVLLAEALTWNTIVGGVLVLVGVVFTQTSVDRTRRPSGSFVDNKEILPWWPRNRNRWHAGGGQARIAGVRIEVLPYDHSDAGPLIDGSLNEDLVRYGQVDQTPVDSADFVAPHGLFLVGYLDDRPVACGGWRTHGPDAELKRMYVAPEARRRGLARSILARLERSAREAGRHRMILETGVKQPEALALYAATGYVKVATFGYYANDPEAIHLGKVLRRSAAVGLSTADGATTDVSAD